ncbi:MAG: RNA polymerase factor sigma-54 [candidate division WOR-3 bacterium]|nr:MAG: RNA polymerase factor sigma-54 [candidate division WOR-3 bacterium]
MNRRSELQFRPELKHYILPTLKYYLKLIELPSLEIETFIRHELEANPLLEEISSETTSESDDGGDSVDEDTPKDLKEIEEFNIAELFADTPSTVYDSSIEEFDAMDNVPAHGDKLSDYLLRQAFSAFQDQDLEIARSVIANIEDDGYLSAPPEEIADEGHDLNDVLRIIKRIQRFDPVGCAWRDKKEPLFVQLDVLGCAPDSVECILVRDYLKDMRSNRYADILKVLKISEERFLKAREIVLKLDPKPGWRYSNVASGYVSPDFMIRWRDNRLIASLNDDTVPRVRLRRQYVEVLKNPKGVPREQLEFIRQRARAAQHVIVAIEQRRKTMLRILDNLLEYQRDFFEKGYNYLRPITMTEFARQLSVNPSTISRALASKYIESPQGIHKLKFFFNAPLGDTDKRIIFKKIQEIVENEDKTSPLSDTQISQKLGRQGIVISRRTVSKYRDLMGIPTHQYRSR